MKMTPKSGIRVLGITAVNNSHVSDLTKDRVLKVARPGEDKEGSPSDLDRSVF